MGRKYLLLMLLALVGCDDGGPAATGSLAVTVQVAPGGTADPDGFRIVAGTDTLVVPSTGGVAEFDGLPTGTMVARVVGRVPWCDATPLALPVKIVDGETATLTITIQCHQASGTVRLITEAQGVDLDTNGYMVTAGGVDHPIGARDTLVLSLPSGVVTDIQFRGIRRTCWPTTDSNRVATASLPGATVDLVFHVDCGVILYQGFPGGAPPRFYQINVTTGTIRPQASYPTNIQGLRSSRDGTRILFFAGDLHAMAPDGSAQVALTSTPEEEMWADWTPDGTGVYYATIEDQRIALLPLPGGVPTLVPGAVPGEGEPTVRSQGDLIAFNGPDTGSSVNIWLMAPDGSGRRRAFPDRTWAGSPDWSPGGDRLVFRGIVGGDHSSQGIFIGTPEGGPATLLSVPTSSDWWPRWSSDGAWIAFVRGSGPRTLNLIKPDGTGLRPLTIPHTWNGEYTWLR